MAVVVEMIFEGATLEQYDEVIQAMGFSPGGPGAPHAYGHLVHKTDSGIRVIDLWESEDEFNKFANDQIGPLSAQAGVPSPPDVTFYELHNYLTPGPPG
jgi:hypothetical protein